uniref:RecA-family ATPase n=1 Tax=Desulfovibrio sp. U5L TaxID=596152 RepID=I2Q6H8_9BACT
MNYSWDEIYRLIQRADQLDAGGRLTIFEFLAQTLSLIPLRDGFPTPAEIKAHGLAKAAKKYKGPVEKGWERWCREKRPFDQANFSTDRAGFACGPASGVLVLDVDNSHLFDQWMQENHPDEPLPVTLKVKTGGHGERFHYYFQYPSGVEQYLCRSIKDIFDIRGIGGQVLCPGSLHPETRRAYIVVENVSIAPAPMWLLEMSKKTVDKKKILKEEHNILDMNSLDLEQTLQTDSFLSSLNISEEAKQKILIPYPKGQRSEPSWSVLLSLLNANIDVTTIRHIYQRYPIGEKAREDSQWFDRELKRAIEIVSADKMGATMQLGFSAGSNSTNSDSEYSMMNGLDVLNSPQSFEFLIDNFWPKNEPLLITGPGGAGKSVMTLQIAMDLVFLPQNGLLDRFKVLSGDHKVLFVQSENSIVGLKRRMEIITQGYAIPPDIIRDKLLFFGRKGDVRSSGDINDDKLKKPIERVHGETGFDILILDPLISFHDQDENSNDAMRRFLDKFFDFCDKLKVTPLMIHHHGKFRAEKGIGGGRGASAIGDWSANTWELEFVEERKDKDGNLKQIAHYLFTQKKARSYESNAKMMLQMKNLRFYPIVLATSVGQAAKLDEKMSIVVEALKSMGGKADNQKKLIQAVKDVCEKNKLPKVPSKATIVNWIDAAVANGHIKVQDGVGGVKVYSF